MNREELIKESRLALEQIAYILGPVAIDCGCEGCQSEMQLALDLSQELTIKWRNYEALKNL